MSSTAYNVSHQTLYVAEPFFGSFEPGESVTGDKDVIDGLVVTGLWSRTDPNKDSGSSKSSKSSAAPAADGSE